MTVIHVHTKIDSETLQLPQLRELIGKMVEITVTEVAQQDRDCLQALDTAAPLDRSALEALKDHVTIEQYEALTAIATAGGPNVEAIRRMRAASMT